MRSSASLVMVLAACGAAAAAGQPPPAATPLPPEAAGVQGPSGTAGTGTQSYDRVGYATTGDVGTDAVAATHRTLPPGSIAEVTALDTGRTILVRIAGRDPDDARSEIGLTGGAAALLGVASGVAPVRVRAVSAAPADASALARGEAASPRIDAPPALLAALRRQLPVRAPARAVTPRTPVSPIRRAAAAKPVPPPARPASPPAMPGRYTVQIAAVSAEARARAIASALGGSVQPAGALWRVRLGPYRDLAAAQRARDAAARRGYADAQIIPAS